LGAEQNEMKWKMEFNGTTWFVFMLPLNKLPKPTNLISVFAIFRNLPRNLLRALAGGQIDGASRVYRPQIKK